MGTWFVTGGTGFIGRHLLKILVDNGHHVKALLRRDPPPDAPATIEWVRGRLESIDSCRAALESCDGIIHLAGLIKAARIEDYFRVNARGTADLIRLASSLQRPIRFIYIISLAAVGPSPHGLPLDESHAPAPLSPYGKSKLAGEKAVQAAPEPVRWTILRPPAVYGPGDRATLPYFRLIARGIHLFLGDPDRSFSLVYGPDVARAIVHTLHHPRAIGQIYFVTHPEILTWRKLAGLLAERLRRPPRIRLSIPPQILYGIGRLNEWSARLIGRTAFLSRDKFRELLHAGWICSGRKMTEELGFTPSTPHPEGIDETIKWYRKQGWL